MNSVKLYSNGTAVISRDYSLTEGEREISIPVRSVDLCDAVGTLTLIGDVTCPEPPSYEPVGANQSSLMIDNTNAMRSLATELAGAKVEVTVGGEVIAGTLMGIQEFTETHGENIVERYRVSIRKEDDGFVSYRDNEVESIKFTEEQVQSEIDKAIQWSYSQIKPDSSFITLKVVPNGDTKSVTVVYAVPVAAWKIRYQLRIESDDWILEQQAVVDNDTDDDWRETNISVVVGEPITFATDLAEIRRPQRSKVNVVASQALGAVAMEEAMPDITFPCMESSAADGYPQDDERSMMQLAGGTIRSRGMMKSSSSSSTFPISPSVIVQAASFSGPQASQAEAEYRESGDFAVFDSPTPVTILSKRSAIIPLDTSKMSDGKIILVYKENTDERRPFRALRFKNTTKQSLGKGVCEIFQDGDIQGKAIINGAKSGEEVDLVFAKETGVKIFKEEKDSQQEVAGLKIGSGMAVWTRRAETTTDYKVSNVKDEEFTLEIEYPRRLERSTIVANVSGATGERGTDITRTDITSGQRIAVKVPAKQNVVVRVEEKGETEQCLDYGGDPGLPGWLASQVVRINNPIGDLAENEEIMALIAIEDELQGKMQEEADESAKVGRIDEDQERLSGLIESFSETAAKKHQTTLDTNEDDRATLVNETIPALVKVVRALVEKRDNAARKFVLDWKAK